MFLRNPKGQKDSMQSLFQSYSSTSKQETVVQEPQAQEADNAIVTLDQMEKHAEQESFRRFQDTLEQESNLEQSLDPARVSGAEINMDGLGEGQLSEDMEKVKEAEIRELKLREKICRESPELVDLRNKLQQAYINKEITLQLAEKEAQKMEQKIMDQYYREQLDSATQKQVQEDEHNEQENVKRKAEYRRALEKQMQDEVDTKREMKYKQYRDEQKLTQDEINRIMEQEERCREEKISKMMKCKQDMEEALKCREDIKLEEKLRKQEDEKKFESYWEQTSKHEKELKQEREEKKNLITQRQEECARTLLEINRRNQTRSELLENITVMSQLIDNESDKKQDLAALDKKLKQSQLCSDLEGQIAAKMRAKEAAKQRSGDFTETWIWGDSCRNKNENEEKQRRMREAAEYNRAAMINKKTKRIGGGGEGCSENKENDDKTEEIEQAKQRLIEEEKERLLKAQDPSLYQYLPAGTLKPSDLAKLPSSQASSNMFRR